MSNIFATVYLKISKHSPAPWVVDFIELSANDEKDALDKIPLAIEQMKQKYPNHSWMMVSPFSEAFGSKIETPNE